MKQSPKKRIGVKSKKSPKANFSKTFLYAIALLIVCTFIAGVLSLNKSVITYAKSPYTASTSTIKSKNLNGIDINVTNNPFSYHPVVIQTKDVTDTFLVKAGKVEDILKELEINYDGYKTSPALDTALIFPYIIKLTKYDVEYVTSTQALGFDTQSIENPKMEIDTQNTLQEGVNGEVSTVVKNVYEDGVLVSTSEFSRTVTVQPIPRVVEYGTAIIPREISIGGDTFTYCRKYHVFATHYDKNCAGCNEYTATGAKLQKGVIAVDPTVIKLGTQMYVPGYGYGTALDTGGGIKGMKIDLGFYDYNQDPFGWNTGYTDIYILCQ